MMVLIYYIFVLFPAEATWAMITVLVVVIVVLVFCCLVPFYRALEKRYHHWEDEENDPRSEIRGIRD